MNEKERLEYLAALQKLISGGEIDPAKLIFLNAYMDKLQKGPGENPSKTQLKAWAKTEALLIRLIEALIKNIERPGLLG